MEWNTRASHTSNLQTNNFQVWASDLSQLNATYNFAQANASTPYPGNEQTIQMPSNRVSSQPLLQNAEQFLNYKPVLPKTSVSAPDFMTPQQLVDRLPVSSAPLSSATVQMQDGIAQNPWPNSNIHVFTSTTVPDSTVNSVPNIPQTLFMAPVIYSNYPQNKSNSVRTSVYPQTKKSSLFSKRQSTPMASYHLKGPPASQVCATVPLDPASNHNLNSQNVSCLINRSGQNNQINGPRSNSAIAMKSQQYTSGHVISTQYTGSTHSFGDVIEAIPPVANINPPPPYQAHPVQKSYVHLSQPVANTSNENVQNHQNLVLDQNSAERNMQYYQKPQPVQSARETNEVGNTANYVNEYKAVDKPANESAKPLFPVLESKNMQMSTPQATKTLVQDENLPNSSGNLGNITKDHLIMNIQNVPDLEKALRQLKDLEMEHKLYITVVKNKKTSDSAHNKNPNVSPSNNTQNQTFLLPHDAKQVFKAPSQDVVLWESQPLSLASQSSSQICDVPLSTTKEHLFPILKDLLQGTVDEDMLLNTFVTKERHQNGHVAVQENGSPSTPLVSGGVRCENVVKNNEETSRTNKKTFPIVPNQEPLKGTNNSLGFEQPSRSAMSQSTNVPTVPGGGLFNHFRLKKNKILAHLSSSVQNPATSNGSSPSTKTIVKESATTCPELLHQSKNTCPQTPEKNVTTGTSVSDASSLALPVTKAAVTTPGAGIAQKLLMTGNSCTMGRTCSWEELKASLTLWVKNLSPLNGLLHDCTESTVSSSSKDDGDKIQQTLENLPNALTQNDQTTAEKSSVASSLGNKLDSVSSGLLKGSEPQVAIVAPLVQSKESVQMKVQKKNLSISLKMDPVIEGSVCNLKELIPTVPDTDRGISSVETGIAVEKVDSLMYQHESKSMDKNGMVKEETNSSYDCSFLELKKVKSEVGSGDEINCLNPVSQKCVTSYENDPNLLKPGDTAEAELNDSMLQISSVCTLVQGDAFYNSQIANIFNTSPVKSSVKNDYPSEEHVPYSQQNKQQSTLLKGESETKMTASAGSILLPSQDSLSKVVAEKPSKDLPGLDMPQKGDTNARNFEEEKSNYWHEDSIISGKVPEQNFSYGGVYRMDLASSDQEFSENQDLFSTAVEDSTYAINNENVKNNILLEENNAQCRTNSESPVTRLNDQLTELLKEYPNGINDSEVQQKSEIKNSIKLTEKDKEETQSCGQNPGPSDAIDQVKHIQSSNKLKNSENDILIDSEDKDGLSSDNISHIETQQLKHIDDTNATAETTVVKTENETYCCMQAFMASRYAVKPCSCKLAGSVDLMPQKSKSTLELKPKGRESRLNNPLKTSALCPVDSVPSGDQSNKFLKKTETDHEVKKSTLSNKKLTPSSFLEKLDPQKPKRANEQERKVLPISEGSQTLKEETTEMDQIYLSENLCSAPTLPHLGTKNFKKVAVQPHSKMESSHKRRNGVVAVSKTDRHHHHNLEIKHRRKNEKFKIKHDTSETHMIKGPNRLSKGLKRQMTMERKHKVLKIQHSVAKNSTNLGSSDLVSNRYKKSFHKSALTSEEHFTKQKWESQRDLEKNDTITLEHSGPSNSEHAQPNKESIKKMNLDKYAYSKERENAWKYKRFLLDNRRIPKVQKQRGHFSSRFKINSFGKEVVLDAHNRDEWSGKSLSEKVASFNKRINKLTLQREQKKSYLNRVSFTETAQESICLKNLEPSPSKSVWRMKSGNVLGNMEVAKTSSSSSLPPSDKKPQMLEFKMCPEILFRTSISEEQATDSKKLPEKGKTPITAVKSKREDWLSYNPAKRRKTVESETQVDHHIPLATALKLLDEVNPVPVKDSKTTFQTYRKMHLEKRSRSLDSSPII